LLKTLRIWLEYSTLEIGAGTLNQLEEFENGCKKYDIVEPFVELYEDGSLLQNKSTIFKDISEVMINTTE